MIGCPSSVIALGDKDKMLRIVTRINHVNLDGAARTELIDALDEADQTAVVRAMRARCAELLDVTKNAINLSAITKRSSSDDVSDVADETGQQFLSHVSTNGTDAYTHGEIFVASDHLLFLLFNQSHGEHNTASRREQFLRVGCIVDARDGETDAQADRATTLLEHFCAQIDERLALLRPEASGRTDARQTNNAEASWQPDKDSTESAAWHRVRSLGSLRDGLADGQISDDAAQATAASSQPTLQSERAVEVLGDAEVRRWLRRLREARQDNRTRGVDGNKSQSAAPSISNEAADKPHPDLTARMRDAGLLNAEIVVSCREAKRALFRLPSSEALAAITATNAVCSECGAMIGDEKIEELGAPTPLAFSLLDGGAWLRQHVRALLKSYGVSEAREFVDLDRADNEDAEAGSAATTTAAMRLLVNYCGELLLIVARDGDFTTAHAARAVDSLIEFDSARLLVVATGEITSDARVRLRSFIESARTTHPPETFFAEGVPAIKSELERVLTHAAQHALRRTLSPVNSDLGFPASVLVEAKFRAPQPQTLDVKNTKRAAESNGTMLSDVVGAVAGRLGSF